MAAKLFRWLAGTCYPRRGPVLEKGKAYNIELYGDELVAYWVKEKAAEFVSEKKEKGGGE